MAADGIKVSLFIFLGLNMFYAVIFCFFVKSSIPSSFILHMHALAPFPLMLMIFFPSLYHLHPFYCPFVVHNFSSSVASSVVDLLSVLSTLRQRIQFTRALLINSGTQTMDVKLWLYKFVYLSSFCMAFFSVCVCVSVPDHCLLYI